MCFHNVLCGGEAMEQPTTQLHGPHGTLFITLAMNSDMNYVMDDGMRSLVHDCNCIILCFKA